MENQLKLIKYLESFVSQNRSDLIHNKIQERTRHLTLVIEDVFQSRNISAITRSADCFGIQDIHIIENKNKFLLDPSVSLGSGKWVNIIRHNRNNNNNTEECISHLKKEGYRIIATTTKKGSMNINDIDIKNNKIALLLGSELNGLSETAINLADQKINIQMFGFTESLNISVAAGICSYHLINIIRKRNNNWRLNESEQQEIILQWLRNSIRSSKEIEKKFSRRNKI